MDQEVILFSSNLHAGFSVLRLVTDPRRGITIPIGTVAWDSERGWYHIRVLSGEEKLQNITSERRMLIGLAESELNAWAERREVPYTREILDPATSEFWASARSALTTGVQLDPPKAMEPVTSSDEIDALFEALVQPIAPRSRENKRIDSALSKALGDKLSNRMRSRLEVAAFHNARERVLRGAVGKYGVVVVEAVNLAGHSARKDADALASKLMRIQAASGALGDIKTIVAYRSSPHGLNGESHMRDWIAETVTSEVFDMTREVTALRNAASSALMDIGLLGQIDMDVISDLE